MAKTLFASATIFTFFMLRTALLFFLLLGFVSSEIQAATTAATKSRPIHRRKPMAGDYRPVYRYYRGNRHHKGLFGGLFKSHSTPRRNAPSKSRAHRTL